MDCSESDRRYVFNGNIVFWIVRLTLMQIKEYILLLREPIIKPFINNVF